MELRYGNLKLKVKLILLKYILSADISVMVGTFFVGSKFYRDSFSNLSFHSFKGIMIGRTTLGRLKLK